LIVQGETEENVRICCQYAANLIDHNLPVVFDVKHLSLLLGMSEDKLVGYIWGDESKLYSIREIPKKNGSKRKLTIPCITLKYIQRWILDNILCGMHVSENSTGFTFGRSILTNARMHLGAEVVINLDIRDFFPSVSVQQVYRLFRYYGYTREISYVFAKLCTYQQQLPQGSPTSPCLSNLACLKLDKRLSALAHSYNAVYSRYADDITFSGRGRLEKLLPIVNQILNEEGFYQNDGKLRILRKGQRQEITGLTINEQRVCVPKAYKRKLKQEIYFCQKYGYEEHQKYIGDYHRYYKEHLYGKAYFVYMIEPEVGKKLLLELEKINWEV